MSFRPDQYYRYDELVDWLRATAEAHSDHLDLRSIGTTPEGRDIWLAAVTDRATGDPDTKPAYWVDGNLHASELMGSTVALHLIARLVEPTGPLEDLLRDIAFYIVPRANPDGAEWCLETGRYVRSARRLYPEQRRRPGFVEEDVDDNGEVLQMRVPDEQGAWRPSDEDPRLLVPRQPWDDDGPFYNLYVEGRFEEEAARRERLPVRDDPHQLDFNRNFPYRWSPEHDQSGSGRYPTSEPEVRALVDFLTNHSNVVGATSLHTYSGALLRPFSDRPDDKMLDFDRAVYRTLGERCERRTGYTATSTYEGFCYDRDDPITGAFDDWAYTHLGVFAFTMELWSPWDEAGLDFSDDLLRFFRGRTEGENLALLEWNDRELDGEGFVDWSPFEHPQLGEVEIGGWRWLFTWRNAPESHLADASRDVTDFLVDHARAAPRPTLELESDRLDSNLRQLTARIENRGYLPTDVTAYARRREVAADLHLELTTRGDLVVEEGRRHRRVDHLDGRANITNPHRSAFTWRGETRGRVATHSWVLRGEGTAEVNWSGDRIGHLTAEIDLDN